MKNILLILVFTFFGDIFCCEGQIKTTKIRPEIKRIARKIAKHNVLTGGAVGYSGTRPKQWDRYEKLKKEATNEELQLLVHHKNAVVRCYSFDALASRKGIDIFPILVKYLSDNKKITTFFGCMVGTETVGDYFLNVITPDEPDDKFYKDLYKLTEKQKATIDSILIFDKTIKINAKYDLLAKILPNPKYYDRIREIVSTDSMPESSIGLARFKNENDIKTIKKLFEKNFDYFGYYAIYCAREFPNEVFYPYLVQIFEREYKEEYYDNLKMMILYQALAKYPTQSTYELFYKTTQIQEDTRYQMANAHLLGAITRYPNTIFDTLKGGIKLENWTDIEMKEEMIRSTP